MIFNENTSVFGKQFSNINATLSWLFFSDRWGSPYWCVWPDPGNISDIGDGGRGQWNVALHCHVANHIRAGMETTFIVKPNQVSYSFMALALMLYSQMCTHGLEIWGLCFFLPQVVAEWGQIKHPLLSAHNIHAHNWNADLSVGHILLDHNLNRFISNTVPFKSLGQVVLSNVFKRSL